MVGVTTTTTYRDIPGFPGYRVGDDGSVWSCRTRKGGTKTAKWVLGDTWYRLVFDVRPTGHLRVTFHAEGKVYRVWVHRLVLETFVGPRPKGMQVCHFPDRDPANNSVGNLRWGTVLDNAADRDIHGTGIKGEKHKLAKLSPDQVRGIRAEYAAGGTTYMQLATKYNVSYSSVGCIVTRKNWAHIE